MSTIGEVYRKVKQLNIAEVSSKAIDNTKEIIADLNAQQLFKGLRSDGSEMPLYSERSVVEFGKPEGPIRLYDTGAFYRGITVAVQSGKITITSTDSKTEKLFKKYATKRKNIFGLNPQFKREYINEVLRKEFRKQVKVATGL